MLAQYINVLGQELIDVSVKVVGFLPNFIIGIIILLVGWLFGLILGRATVHVFDILKINHLFGKLGFTHISRKSGHDVTVGNFFGALVKWTVIVAFTLAAANIFGLFYVSSFLVGVLAYLPSVFVAGFILIIANIFGNLAEKVIDGSVRSAGLQVSFAGTLAKYAIIVTGILAALNQLNIVPVFTNALFIAIVGALALAFGLAFGLGGKDAAARAIERLERDFTKK
jgi:predicted secreted protein